MQLVYDWDMRLSMNDEQIQTLEQVKQFVEGSQAIAFKGINAEEKYIWIEEVLRKFKYRCVRRDGKGLIRSYLIKLAVTPRLRWSG